MRERVSAYRELSIARLLREIRELGYPGGKTALGDFVREVRPPAAPLFEVRFETAPGEQAQVDFAHFKAVFDDEPGVVRVVWLFSMVLDTAATCSRAFACTRICRRCCACISRPSSTSMGCRVRFSTIA